MTRTDLLPAVLGGSPAFPERLRFAPPRLVSIDEVSDGLRRMFASGQWTNNGPSVQALEARVAEYLDVPHCVAVVNATAGLLLIPSLWALKGEVIVPSFTFPATAHALVWNGLTPVFVDIDPRTLTIDPAAVEAALSPQTCAIVCVCIFGTPPDMAPLEALAHRHYLRLMCDSAQGFGTVYEGRRLGGFGDAEVVSFHATKALAAGEGGAILTRDDALARRARLARHYGRAPSGDCELVGLNAKMPEWAALLSLAGMNTFDHDLARRRALLALYARRVRTIPGLAMPEVPTASCVSNGQNCTVIVDRERFGLSRDELHRALETDGIECQRYYDPPLHRTTVYANRPWRREPLLETERLASAVLSLPLHLRMTLEDVGRVCDVLEALHDLRRDARRTLHDAQG